MIKGIQDWQLGRDEGSLRAAAKAACGAGFDAFEPVVGDSGLLSRTAAEANARLAGKIIRGEGLAVADLACDLPRCASLSSTDAAARTRALEIVTAGLDRTAWLGAEALIVGAEPLSEPNEAGERDIGYADALNALFASLEDLYFDAESRGIVIGLQCPAGDFLLSPVETRDLIDAIGSAWVRVCLDVTAVRRHGDPVDWIKTLGARVAQVHVGPPDFGRNESHAWVAALKQAGYGGAITCVRSEPAGLARSLDTILRNA